MKKNIGLDFLLLGCIVWNLLQGRLAQLVRASRLHRECRRFESVIAHHFQNSPPTGLLVGFFVLGVNLSSTRVLPDSGESPLFSYEGVLQTLSR